MFPERFELFPYTYSRVPYILPDPRLLVVFLPKKFITAENYLRYQYVVVDQKFPVSPPVSLHPTPHQRPSLFGEKIFDVLLSCKKVRSYYALVNVLFCINARTLF